MGGGWEVKNLTDDKAISAPSWGLACWLGLSLAIIEVHNDFEICSGLRMLISARGTK